MPKVTTEQLQREIQDLARSVAENFATKEDLKLLRQDMQNGFALVMEELRPMRRDYQALKDDMAPQLADHDARITKLEQSISR